MPTHDIIDNRHEKLVDHISRSLASTESGKFAVGCFFLSGLEAIADRMSGMKELRLLIGSTTNRETLEQLAEGYQRLERVSEKLEEQAYPKKVAAKQMVADAAAPAGPINAADRRIDDLHPFIRFPSVALLTFPPA